MTDSRRCDVSPYPRWVLRAILSAAVLTAALFSLGPRQASTTPSAFIFPMDCVLNIECFYVNYIDHDPSPGLQDYMCGVETLDGHGGTDITLRDFRLMDEGVDVYAAAAGTVVAVKDGHFDRNKEAGPFPVNFVEIEHADGLITSYLHLRNGSVAVSIGESVVQGQKIGEVGSSGSSTAPHLHFQVTDSGSIVDPWTGPCGNTVSLWAAQDPYEDDFLLIDHYLLGEIPSLKDLKEGPLSIISLHPTAGFVCYAVQVLSVHVGDTREFRFVGPLTLPHSPFTQTEYYRHSYSIGCKSADTLRLNPGQWEAQYWHNGVFVSSRTFSVVTAVGGIAELPEEARAALEAPASSGLDYRVVAGASAALVATLIAMSGAAWFARRRWLG